MVMHAYVAMAQDFLHYLGIYSHAQKQCCGTVPQIMEWNMWESGLFEHSIKHFQYITWIERPTFQSCEDVILLMPYIHTL